MFVDESCSELVYMRKVVRVLQMVVGGVRWRSSRRLKSYSEYLAGDNKEERRRDPRPERVSDPPSAERRRGRQQEQTALSEHEALRFTSKVFLSGASIFSKI